ncbi:MAG: efflux RND transporter periplasmic adaptor subunit [Anaerolineae bacterium]|nr:MAG: efflux RND transporter periplasmic adaptor subunit [Anaerolineae bacterium]
MRVANGELERGIAALKAGRREEARRSIARAVSADPKDATAWLWLSRCVHDEAQRRECLERALRLDPTGEAARRMAEDERRTTEDGRWTTEDERRKRDDGRRTTNDDNRLLTANQPRVTHHASRITDHGSRITHHAPRITHHVSRLAPHRRLLLSVLALAVVVLVCALAPRVSWLASPAQPARGEVLEASGIIQAEEVLVASEWGGTIAAIPVGEGDKVAAGEVLVQLDTALLDAQIEAARAAVALAEAGLVQAKAGARAGQIAVAEAQLAQAETARLAAMQAVSDTLALVENPQEVRLQIAVAQAQAEAAKHQVAQAVAVKDAVEVAKDKFENVRDIAGSRRVLIATGPKVDLPDLLPPEIRDGLESLVDGVYTFGNLELHLHGGTYELYRWVNVHIPLELHLAPNQWWQAWVGVNAAVARQEGIDASLAHLYAQKAHPQSLEARADEALAALAQAEAQIAAAQAQVDGLKAGATEEQMAALAARVVQAQAALDSLLTQRATMAVTSPMDGTVVSIAAHPGEVAAPGAALLTVAGLDEVRLAVYVPETRVGQVQLGGRVQVRVDSFPGRIFDGQVTHVADRAEFTPRNVATKEERVNLVFAVEIRLANDDGALKPGMPADAVFGE